jgi:hypothetical protein
MELCQPSTASGRELSSVTNFDTCSPVCTDSSVLFGKYWRSSPWTLTDPLSVVLMFVRMLVCGRQPPGHCY